MRLTGRTKSAEFVNEFLNNLDASKQAENENNYAFFGEHGGILCTRVNPGIYELTIAVKEGTNPSWTKQMAEEVFTLMFTETNAVKLIGAIENTNKACLKLAKSMTGSKVKQLDDFCSSFECTIGRRVKAAKYDKGVLCKALKDNKQTAKMNLLSKRWQLILG